MTEVQNVVIIWWWPAWHTAAIYTARAWLNPIMYEWFMAWWMPPGGQLTTTTTVENFPWFPDGIGWLELMTQMKQQSENQWAKILWRNFDQNCNYSYLSDSEKTQNSMRKSIPTAWNLCMCSLWLMIANLS